MSPAIRTSALLASSLMLGVVSAHAVTFDFNSDSQFLSNFEPYAVPNGTFAQSASSGKLTWTTSGGQTGAFVYDTNGATSGGVANFLPGVGNSVVVEFDFSTNVNNVGFGVFFGGARSAEYLALFNINNNVSNDQLRIFSVANWNASTPSSGGTTTTPAANAATTTGTNGWATNTLYHAKLTMTYTSATTADVSYLITDPYTVSSPVSSFSVTATNMTVSATSNEIGFRVGSASNASILSVDNISIVTTSSIPEPSAFAAFAGLATLGFAATRRRRSS